MKDRAGGGVDGVKNRSGKCEGPGEGEGRQGKELEWEMQRIEARGGDQ